MRTMNFDVDGMACGGCEMTIREEVATLPGVTEVDVRVDTGKLVVTGTEPADETKLVALLKDDGYTATRIDG